MKKFFIRLVLFILLLYVSGAALQYLIDRGLKKEHGFQYDEWSEIFRSNINAGILIQGNSRALMQYSPRIIDSAFLSTPFRGTKGWNSYNLGIEGYGFYMQYYRFLLCIKYNKTPQFIIQNIDPMTLAKGDTLINYFQFLPYLNDDTIRKMVSAYYGLDWRDFYIPLYKYKGNYQLAYQGLKNNFSTPQQNHEDYKGFHTNNWGWDRKGFENFKLNYPAGYHVKADKVTIDLLGRFLNTCNSKGIKVIFVCAPEYYEAQKMVHNRDSIMNIFRNYSAQYHIPLLDYSNDSLCFDTLNFYNSQHLNMTGVRKFNRELVRDLKWIVLAPLNNRRPSSGR